MIVENWEIEKAKENGERLREKREYVLWFLSLSFVNYKTQVSNKSNHTCLF